MAGALPSSILSQLVACAARTATKLSTVMRVTANKDHMRFCTRCATGQRRRGRWSRLLHKGQKLARDVDRRQHIDLESAHSLVIALLKYRPVDARDFPAVLRQSPFRSRHAGILNEHMDAIDETLGVVYKCPDRRKVRQIQRPNFEPGVSGRLADLVSRRLTSLDRSAGQNNQLRWLGQASETKSCVEPEATATGTRAV